MGVLKGRIAIWLFGELPSLYKRRFWENIKDMRTFSEGPQRVPPSGGRKAKPRSTNAVRLLFHWTEQDAILVPRTGIEPVRLVKGRRILSPL